MARLTADIFVSALVRRIFADGGAGAIERKGAYEAGAVFLRVRHRDGSETLLSPAPQSWFDEDHPQERAFEVRCARKSEAEIGEILAREIGFDPDLWVVEIETDQPETYCRIIPRS